MLLNKLVLSAFGKFKDKFIDLEQGINIIYAENEGGKSTVHSFIDGIFYGFSKDSLRAKRTDELFDKYKPWQGNDYRGYIELEKKDIYRVSRDFFTNEVEVLNLYKGIDISDEAIYKKYSRIKEPGVYFFSMTRSLFKSTFYIRQLESSIDNEAASMLKERISNFLSSKDQRINYKHALERLEEDLDLYGKETRSKSKIGSINERLKQINKEKITLDEDRLKYFQKLLVLNEEKTSLEKDKKLLSSANHRAYINLKEEIELLQDKIEKAKVGSIDILDFQKAVELNKEIKKDYSQIDQLYEEKNEVYQIDSDIEEDFKKFQSAKEDIANLNAVNYSKEMEFLSVDIRKSAKERNLYLIKIILSLFGIIAVGFLSYFFKKYYLFFLIIPILIYTYLRIVKFKANIELVSRLNIRMEELKNNSMEKTAKKKQYDILFRNLADKYNLANTEDLFNCLNNNILENNKLRAINEYRKEKSKDIEDRKNKLNEEIISLQEALNKIFQKYTVISINDLRERYENNGLLDLEKNLALKKDLLNKMPKNFEEEPTKESVDLSLEEIEKSIADRELKIAKVNGELNLLENSIKKLKDLKEEEDILITNLKDLEYKRDYTELALNRLKEILFENRNKLLPRLKEKIEEILGNLTQNKYNKIIVDDNYNLSVYDYENSKYVNIDNLSRGSIDQLYFAFRLAILEILFTEDFPIILDDHFSNYDDKRLESTLKYLKRFKQVIIFTSNKREIEILEKNKEKYNLIYMR